jgi:hypothetical protein
MMTKSMESIPSPWAYPRTYVLCVPVIYILYILYFGIPLFNIVSVCVRNLMRILWVVM